MELDKRILPNKRPLTCLDIEQAREFVGKECIFSDNYDNYRDIEKYDIENDNEYTAILSIDDDTSNGDYVFRNSKINSRYRLILPVEWVKEPEKKYRAFTNEEFLNLFDAGKLHSIRRKNKRGRYIITEIYFNDDCEKDTVYVKLNHCDAGFAMRYLVNNDFEYFDGKEWLPFGVEE